MGDKEELDVIERIVSDVPVGKVAEEFDDKTLKRFVNIYNRVYEEKFADQEEDGKGLTVEQIVRDYDEVKSELDKRGLNYEASGTLNSLSDDFNKSLFSDESDTVQLDRKSQLTNEVNVYYVGNGDVWIEGEKSYWARNQERENPLEEDPDEVVDDSYEDEHLKIDVGKDGTLVRYGQLSLAHDVSPGAEFDSGLATRRFSGKGDNELEPEDFEEMAKKYNSVFLLTEGNLDGSKFEHVDESHLIGPTEWICGLGRVKV